MPRELPTGIARTKTGYRVFVWVPDPRDPKGRIKSKRYKADATLDEMKHWREAQRVQARKRTLTKTLDVPTGEGFKADAERYLDAVTAMPTFEERCKHIQEWAALFGERPRDEIASSEIRAQRDRWLTVGPKMVQERQADGKVKWVPKAVPLSASSVNHRLRALENMWTVLWPHEPNPVRDVPEADPPEDAPRAVPYELVRAILDAMPERSQGLKGQSRSDASKTKARLAVIAYAGLSHSQLMRVQPEDVDLKARTLFLRPRRKGRKGRQAKGRTIPLLPAAVKAFRHFIALDCWGRFSASSMRTSFRRACAELDFDASIRPYDFRHGFGSRAYAATGDLHATGLLMGHRDPRTTARYTLAAVDPRLAAAMKAMVRSGKVSPPKQSRSVRTSTRKKTEDTE
jgi:integrase